jgi:hypothetical protein
MIRLRSVFAPAAALLASALAANSSVAGPSPYAPDAWVRGNNASTSYFGWDFFETDGPPNFGTLWMLDDSSPDLGSGITATSTRIYQGVDGFEDPLPTEVGHVSSTGNYYSLDETFDGTIAAMAPASGAGGFTTVVLQLDSTMGGDTIADLQFSMEESAASWTLQKHLHNTHGDGLGYHWLEWTRPGGNVRFQIHITSLLDHRPVESFEIDTYWSPTGPVVNAITAVPEPATWALAMVVFVPGIVWRRA